MQGANLNAVNYFDTILQEMNEIVNGSFLLP
jgi:hypothetical protein